MSTISPHDLKLFQTIYEFVDNIYQLYGDPKAKTGKLHALNMYHRLLVKVQFKDDDIMLRHVQAFSTFCMNNSQAIEMRNWKAFTSHKILFTEKIYIDMYWIFQKALSDEDITNTCWQYLLTCYALIDKDSNASKILENMMNDLKNNNNSNSDIMSNLSQLLPIFSSLGNINVSNRDDFVKLIDSPQLNSLLQVFSSLTGQNISKDIKTPEFKNFVGICFDKFSQFRDKILHFNSSDERLEYFYTVMENINLP